MPIIPPQQTPDEICPVKLNPWICHQASLTEKLRQIAGEAVVQVISQGWTNPGIWDTQVLHGSDRRIWCREIIMSANAVSCWYARSVFPEATYAAHPAFFEQLKRVSLGELIFNSPAIQRESMIDYAIDGNALEYQWLPDSIKPDPAQRLWLRRSTFTMDRAAPFYLMELFLPDLERYCD
jgi:chorismate lyase